MTDDRSPISPESQKLVDKILASRAANPEHDRGCLLCGATFVLAMGHQCDSSPTVTDDLTRALEVAEELESNLMDTDAATDAVAMIRRLVERCREAEAERDVLRVPPHQSGVFPKPGPRGWEVTS